MTNINLMELYDKGIIKDGGHNVNVPIKKANGDNYNGKTYAIPLKYLYYNEQNGRIGVSLSDYEIENEKLVSGHNEEYNMIVQEMLTNTDDKTKKDMKELKRNIILKGQEEPGYVLNDGRVIDGNRRFSAKRLLEQDVTVTEPQYFEAVILNDLSVQNHEDQKKIKSLELQIQFGKLDKVDYNPIDRSIDAYKTINLNNIMTVNEYADYSGLSPKEINKRVLEAELIIKFLEFVNTSPDNYSLAKQLDLDGPLQDMIPQYKKIKGSENEDQLINSLFAKIIQMKSTREDFKNEFRHIVKSVVGTKNESQFVEEMEDATDSIIDCFDKKDIVKNNVDLFDSLQSDKEIIEAIAEVKKISTKHSEKAKNYKEQKMPVNLIEKAINSIDSIDKKILLDLPIREKNKINASLIKLKELVDSLFIEEE